MNKGCHFLLRVLMTKLLCPYFNALDATEVDTDWWVQEALHCLNSEKKKKKQKNCLLN